MKLYHFTARHHLDGGPGHAGPGILKVGILPNRHPSIALPPHVWLTSDPSFDQPWSRWLAFADCDRTEVRLTIAVPRERLLFGEAIRRAVPPAVWDDLTRYARPEPWAIIVERIPPGWIRSVAYRPVADVIPIGDLREKA